jgi:hypothetical protein
MYTFKETPDLLAKYWKQAQGTELALPLAKNTSALTKNSKSSNYNNSTATLKGYADPNLSFAQVSYNPYVYAPNYGTDKGYGYYEIGDANTWLRKNMPILNAPMTGIDAVGILKVTELANLTKQIQNESKTYATLAANKNKTPAEQKTFDDLAAKRKAVEQDVQLLPEKHKILFSLATNPTLKNYSETANKYLSDSASAAEKTIGSYGVGNKSVKWSSAQTDKQRAEEALRSSGYGAYGAASVSPNALQTPIINALKPGEVVGAPKEGYTNVGTGVQLDGSTGIRTLSKPVENDIYVDYPTVVAGDTSKLSPATRKYLEEQARLNTNVMKSAAQATLNYVTPINNRPFDIQKTQENMNPRSPTYGVQTVTQKVDPLVWTIQEKKPGSTNVLASVGNLELTAPKGYGPATVTLEEVKKTGTADKAALDKAAADQKAAQEAEQVKQAEAAAKKLADEKAAIAAKDAAAKLAAETAIAQRNEELRLAKEAADKAKAAQEAKLAEEKKIAEAELLKQQAAEKLAKETSAKTKAEQDARLAEQKKLAEEELLKKQAAEKLAIETAAKSKAAQEAKLAEEKKIAEAELLKQQAAEKLAIETAAKAKAEQDARLAEQKKLAEAELLKKQAAEKLAKEAAAKAKAEQDARLLEEKKIAEAELLKQQQAKDALAKQLADAAGLAAETQKAYEAQKAKELKEKEDAYAAEKQAAAKIEAERQAEAARQKALLDFSNQTTANQKASLNQYNLAQSQNEQLRLAGQSSLLTQQALQQQKDQLAVGSSSLSQGVAGTAQTAGAVGAAGAKAALAKTVGAPSAALAAPNSIKAMAARRRAPINQPMAQPMAQPGFNLPSANGITFGGS